MRISVIKTDGFVSKDGKGFGGLDLSFLPSNVRAFQWYETFGEIEFSQQIIDGQLVTPQNEFVSVEPDWFSQILFAWEFGLEMFNQIELKIEQELANPQEQILN